MSGRNERRSTVPRALALAVVCVIASGSTQHPDPAPGTVESITIPGSEVSFELVWLPGGRFTMGSPDDESGREPDEVPRHEVELSPFWIGRHEVTHDEYQLFRHRRLDSPAGAERFDLDAVSRPTPPYEDPAHGLGKDGHPAVGMTRRAALQYARWLSEKTGRLFRLPTEAEWEYACRAGSDHRFGYGNDPALSREYAWTQETAERSYHAVGTLAPNDWGIFDLHGNVAEWVMDGYVADAYTRGAATVRDPQVGDPPNGRGVVRGGSYLDAVADTHCAERLPEDARWKRRDPQIPKSRWWNTDAPHVGFRLVSPAGDLDPDAIRAYWRELFDETETTGPEADVPAARQSVVSGGTR